MSALLTARSPAHRGGSGAPPEARLLVVDDEPNIVELLAASLRFAGFEVHTATNGTPALHGSPRSARTSWCST